MALKGLEKGAGSKISIHLYFKDQLLLASPFGFVPLHGFTATMSVLSS